MELAAIEAGVAVRDSKNPRGGELHFGRDAFCAFAARVKAGGYDR